MKTTKTLAILVLTLGLTVCSADISRAAPMGTAFTYQGHLYDANHIADGLYDFQFKLYDVDSGDSQVGSDVNKPDVDVINGYFTVELDFGSDPNSFNGNARWLEIGVRPGDMNDPNAYKALEPRQEVTPAPYAICAGKAGDLSLPYSGTVSDSGTAFIVSNTGTGKAIQGIGNNNDGMAGGSTAPGRSGVFGYNDNASGFGVFGSSINGIGVKGYTYGDTGKAGLFEIQNANNNNPALKGVTIGTGEGVYGVHSSSGNYGYLGDDSKGVYGYSQSDSGIYGESSIGRGVYGEASASSGVNYGIYGKTNSTTGYAGYFEGAGYFSSNVGIGTTEPTSPLTIQPVVGADIEFPSSGNNADILSAASEFHIGTTNNGSLSLLTGNSFRLTVEGGGDVGIGTITPAAALEVGGEGIASHLMLTNLGTVGPALRLNALNRDWVIWGTNPGASAGDQKLVFRDYSAAADRMAIDSNGNVGIGTTSPGYKLEVNGNVDADGFSIDGVPIVAGVSPTPACAGIDNLTVDSSSQVTITFSGVTFTNATNIKLSASAIVTTAATGAGFPARITGVSITTANATLTLECWNGSVYTSMAQDDIVQVSWVAVEPP